jgi:FMN-dependent NADH-azoreductase
VHNPTVINKQFRIECAITPASLFEHQKSYIDFWVHLVGVEKIHSIVIENTWRDRVAETLAKGENEAIRLVGQL